MKGHAPTNDRGMARCALDREIIDRARGADAGLLLIHGAGVHPPKETLSRILEPTLKRLYDEEQLVSTTPFQIGDPAQPGGPHDAVLVEYTAAPGDHTRPIRPDSKNVKRLVVVEGRWFDAYTTPGKKAVSIWFGRHSVATSWGMFWHHVSHPSWLLLGSVIVLFMMAFALAGAWIPWFGFDIWHEFVLLSTAAGIALALGAISAWIDVVASDNGRNSGFRRREHLGQIAIFMFVTSAFYMQVQLQRAFMMIASALAVFVLPAVSVLARVLASVPILAGLSANIVATAEHAFMSGSPASLQAVADSHLAAGAIQRRMRDALAEMQSLLRDGATITVLGYSTGGPIAWHLLSDPSVVYGEGAARFRYRLLTVGSQLNWARGGYDSKASRLNRPLVNSDVLLAEKPTPVANTLRPFSDGTPTLWLNFYGTMDPSPQGAVRPSEFEGWDPEERLSDPRRWWSSWDEAVDSPNRAVTNLGSPLSGEHGEYFANQQEFVPALVRAIDDEISWAAADADKTKPRRDFLSNLRIGMVAPLARFRAIFFGLALFALWTLLHGENLMTVPDPNPPDGYNPPAPGIWDNRWLQEQLVELRGFAEGRWFESFLNGIFDNQWLLNTVIMVLFWLLIYAIVEGYTNFLWAGLGRAPRSWLDRKPGYPRIPIPTIASVWLPVLAAPASLLIYWGSFDDNEIGAFFWTLGIVAVLHTALTIAEIIFIRQCVDASRNESKPSVYKQTARYPTQEPHMKFERTKKDSPPSSPRPIKPGAR